MLNEELMCNLGHKLTYEIVDDASVMGGVAHCAEPGCIGLISWKRRMPRSRRKMSRHGLVVQAVIPPLDKL